MQLDSKVIIITGAAKGQGASHARIAAQRGATVIVADFDEEFGEKTAESIRAEGGKAEFIRLDVSSRSDWNELAAAVEKKYGRVDGLVNNAGISLPSDVLNTDDETWNRIVNVNQVGPYLGMQIIAPLIIKTGGGAIVNVASTLGKYASAAAFAYQGTKGAVRMLSKSAALYLAPQGVRVNTVLPGLVDTDFIAGHKKTGALENSLERIPLHRVGNPEEVSAAVLFLLSDEASYINGTEIVVDGGMITCSASSLKPAGED